MFARFESRRCSLGSRATTDSIWNRWNLHPDICIHIREEKTDEKMSGNSVFWNFRKEKFSVRHFMSRFPRMQFVDETLRFSLLNFDGDFSINASNIRICASSLAFQPKSGKYPSDDMLVPAVTSIAFKAIRSIDVHKKRTACRRRRRP